LAADNARPSAFRTLHPEDIIRETEFEELGLASQSIDSFRFAEIDSERIPNSVAVLEKNEVCSPGFVIRRQKNAIESFTWDPNYASDIIEMSSCKR